MNLLLHPFCFVGVFLFFSGQVAGGAVCLTLAVLYLVLLWLIQAALETIFKAAVYVYATQGQAPEGFEGGLLSSAMSRQ